MCVPDPRTPVTLAFTQDQARALLTSFDTGRARVAPVAWFKAVDQLRNALLAAEDADARQQDRDVLGDPDA